MVRELSGSYLNISPNSTFDDRHRVDRALRRSERWKDIRVSKILKASIYVLKLLARLGCNIGFRLRSDSRPSFLDLFLFYLPTYLTKLASGGTL